MRDSKADRKADDRADRKTLAAARPLAIIAALAAFGCAEPGAAAFSVTFGADRSPEPLSGPSTIWKRGSAASSWESMRTSRPSRGSGLRSAPKVTEKAAPPGPRQPNAASAAMMASGGGRKAPPSR